jgi:ALG3 protein
MHFVDLQMASVGMQAATPAQLAAGVVAGAVLQGALASPFLAAAPLSYVSSAFELSRVFLHRWTVTSQVPARGDLPKVLLRCTGAG